MTWNQIALGEVLPFRYGKGLPARIRTETGEYSVVSSAGITGTHDTPLTTGPSVVIGRKGTIGATYYCPQPVWPIDTSFYVEPSESVDIRFAYYLLKSLPLREMNNDSAVPGLNRTEAESLEILLPPLAEQRAIAATLGALDDKIESNQRTVETLERLGAAILEEVLKLDVYGFPDYRSDLRMGDVVSLLETGSRPKGGVSTEGQGVVSLGAESIQSAGFTSTTRFKKVPREFFEKMRRGRLTDGDVLIYKDGGSPGNFVPHISAFGYGFPVEEAAINEHVYRARGSDEVSQGLLYWLLRSPWMDGEMRKRGTGVAIPGLNSTNFRDLPWPVMAPQVQRGLNGALNPMLVLMLRLGAENRRIASLCDVLLPELLSGRIRVPVEGAQA